MSKPLCGIRVSIAVFTLLPALCGAALHPTDIWMETRMAGQPAGYLHERTDPGEGGAVVSISESRTVINRLGSRVEIRGDVREQQSVSGRLLGMRAEISSSLQSTVMEGSVRYGAILLHISTGGKTYDRTIPFTGELLGPEGARQLTLAHLAKPGDSISYQIFAAELGAVSTVTRTSTGRDGVGMRIEESITGMPGKAALTLDEEGRTLRRAQPGPFGEIEFIRTTAERAQAATAGATLAAEMFQRSIIHSNIRLPQEREIEGLRIRVTHRKPQLGWPEFASEYQTVLEKSANSMLVEMRRPALVTTAQPVAVADARLKPYLEPNALFQSDDAEVRKIAREVVGEKHEPLTAALALRDWTSANVHFDAGIAIAPASEVVRSRAGTCFGYSVLLGSLARAAGIPSRMKMGFVYTKGIWGGHAWIEVWIAGRWLPIDAALPSPGIADAARLSFFTSSLEEGTISGLGSLAQMFGNADIEILSYTLGGKTVATMRLSARVAP